MLHLILLLVGAMMLVLMILRFVQPELVYWLRKAFAGVRRNMLFLRRDEDKDFDNTEYIEIYLNDLRPEGVPGSCREVLARVTKIRELYSLLDLNRVRVRELPVAHRSNICIVELANMVSALAKNLEPSPRVSHRISKADQLLRLLAGERGDRSFGKNTGEEEIAEHYQTIPISIEQINEILIAAIYGMAYRLESQEEISIDSP